MITLNENRGPAFEGGQYIFQPVRVRGGTMKSTSMPDASELRLPYHMVPESDSILGSANNAGKESTAPRQGFPLMLKAPPAIV